MVEFLAGTAFGMILAALVSMFLDGASRYEPHRCCLCKTVDAKFIACAGPGRGLRLYCMPCAMRFRLTGGNHDR